MRTIDACNQEIMNNIDQSINYLESLFAKKNVLAFRQILLQEVNEWNNVFVSFGIRPCEGDIQQQHQPRGDSAVANAVYERQVGLFFEKFKRKLSELRQICANKDGGIENFN